MADTNATGETLDPEAPQTQGATKEEVIPPTSVTPDDDKKEQVEETPKEPEGEPKVEPKEPTPDEDPEIKGKKDALSELDKQLYEKRNALRALNQPKETVETPAPEKQDAADVGNIVDEKTKPIAGHIARQQQEYSNMALREISEDPVFDRISPKSQDSDANFKELQTNFERMYPDGFVTKEGYTEAIKRVYAFTWPDQFAKAASEQARTQGQIDMISKSAANIGGTSSSVKEGGTRDLSSDERKALNIYNQDKSKDKQMSESEYAEYLGDENKGTELNPLT